MVTVRYKKLNDHKYSTYLDIYSGTGQGKGKRNYEFLKIYVTKHCFIIILYKNRFHAAELKSAMYKKYRASLFFA
jgi:hypothetical protein